MPEIIAVTATHGPARGGIKVDKPKTIKNIANSIIPKDISNTSRYALL